MGFEPWIYENIVNIKKNIILMLHPMILINLFQNSTITIECTKNSVPNY